MCVDVVKN